jgi:hypothetical protein
MNKFESILSELLEKCLPRIAKENFMNERRSISRMRRDKKQFLVCTYSVIKNIYYFNFIAEFLILKQ